MLEQSLPALTLDDQPGPVALSITRLLRQAIITNRLPPGRALPETELAARLGVSRQPVREALIRLAEGGLVRTLPQRGTLVSRISLARVAAGRFVRDAVERATIRRAAEAAPPGTEAILHRLINAQEAALARHDHPAFLALDDELHGAFATAAGHGPAWALLADVKLQMDRVRYLSIPEATPGALLIEQHRHIAEAIARRAPDAAEAAMRGHLEQVLSALPRLTALFPDHFDGDEA